MDVREAMEVCDADGQMIGTIEHIDGTSFVAGGQRLGFDAIERVEANAVHLWGKTAAYAAADTDAEIQKQREQSQQLPNTDAGLYVNERAVTTSMEERMPEETDASQLRKV